MFIACQDFHLLMMTTEQTIKNRKQWERYTSICQIHNEGTEIDAERPLLLVHSWLPSRSPTCLQQIPAASHVKTQHLSHCILTFHLWNRTQVSEFHRSPTYINKKKPDSLFSYTIYPEEKKGS